MKIKVFQQQEHVKIRKHFSRAIQTQQKNNTKKKNLMAQKQIEIFKLNLLGISKIIKNQRENFGL